MLNSSPTHFNESGLRRLLEQTRTIWSPCVPGCLSSTAPMWPEARALERRTHCQLNCCREMWREKNGWSSWHSTTSSPFVVFFKCNVERLVLRRTNSLLLKYDLKNFLLCTFFELHVSNRPPPFYSSHLNTDKCTLSSLNAAIYLLLEPICLTINIFVLHFTATLGHGFTTLAC